MYKGKYSTALTVILIVVIVAILVVVAIVSVKEYKNYKQEKENEQAIVDFDKIVLDRSNDGTTGSNDSGEEVGNTAIGTIGSSTINVPTGTQNSQGGGNGRRKFKKSYTI